MVEDSGNKQPATDRTGEFFNVGAPLHAVRPGYIKRPADDLLFETLAAGHYAHVLAPDRTGKSSLIASTSARLQNQGFKVAVLDLEQIGERDGGSDAGRWYYSIAYRLCRQLRLKTDLQTWWQDHSILSNRQRLVEFYSQVVLQNIQERIVVFVDEVQCVGELPFAEHLLASIRAAHNARLTEPEFKRLGFALAGECDAASLAGDPNLSPFNVSTEVRLDDFSRPDLQIFAPELNLSQGDADIALDRIFYWTNGQPYLSQKLARAIAREAPDGDIEEHVDRLAVHQLAGRAALTSEPLLSHLHRAIVSDRKNFEALLTIHGQVSKGIMVAFDPDSDRHRRLLALGLLVRDSDGNLAVRNRIYESVFTASWANENLPFHWRGPALAALVVIALTAIPFAYTQLLPKPYLRVMTNPDFDLETVANAYVNLRSFPGHDDSADRLYRSVLEARASRAADRGDIREVSRFAAVLPDGLALADQLEASFWDRQAVAAMRREQRDAALLASLEALTVSTQTRRRRAASLVGDDYPALIATVPAREAAGVVFDAQNAKLTYFDGAEVTQWSVVDSGLEAREPWTISALEVSPLLRRVIVDRDGTAARIGLTVNVSHPRLDDIRMRLISPSGRAAELEFDRPASAANEEIRIPPEQLTPLMGEALDGTWSLSLRDEATGVTGHLNSWNLSLNSQVLVESFERGLDIPDPVERPSENLWFSGDGRYAVARAVQSDSARVWNLNFAQAARTIAVPASQRVLGLSVNAGFLVTMSQNTVNLWRASDGRRDKTLELGASVSDTMLTADGRHLVVTYQSDPDTIFEVWDLESGNIVAETSIAGSPALVAIDASAQSIAVADYDRAVRIWDLRRSEQKAQFDLDFQPTRIELSANGEALAALLGGQGVSVWRTDSPDAPLYQEVGRGEWQLAFSPSGARFIAGNQHEGLQVYRTADAMPTGPAIDPGLRAGGRKLTAFNGDEDMVVTAGQNDIARFWSMPVVAADPASERASNGAPRGWRESATSVAAVAPGGDRIAFGDRSGHVHIDSVAAGPTPDVEELSYLGHQEAVMSLTFSPDGTLVASAAADGSVRIWDARNGSPRPFYGRAVVGSIDAMVFSPSNRQLAVLGGQRVWLMDTASGAELASVDLGEPHNDIAFDAEGRLYLGGQGGTLRGLSPDRTGGWHLRNVWQGPAAIMRVDVAPVRSQIVLADAENRVLLLDPATGQVSTEVMQLPNEITDLSFSPNESRVLLRSGRWMHRALITPAGLLWTDSIRSPKASNGSRLAFDLVDDAGPAARSGDRVLVLERDTGVTRLAELHFGLTEGEALFGTREDLLNDWILRLQGPANTNEFTREGY